MGEGARESPADRGSVLVEAMVAVAIIALVLAVSYRAMGDSALRSRAAESSRTAMLIAQSTLARVGGEIPLEVGRVEGVDGDFAWLVDIDDEPSGPSATGQLLRVRVIVRDKAGRARRASLTSLRISPQSSASEL
jgi:hypothetical protein